MIKILTISILIYESSLISLFRNREFSKEYGVSQPIRGKSFHQSCSRVHRIR